MKQLFNKLNQPLRPQFALLMILLALTVVLALVSRVIVFIPGLDPPPKSAAIAALPSDTKKEAGIREDERTPVHKQTKRSYGIYD